MGLEFRFDQSRLRDQYCLRLRLSQRAHLYLRIQLNLMVLVSQSSRWFLLDLSDQVTLYFR